MIYRLWFHPLAAVPGPTILAATHLPLHYWDSLMGIWVHRVPELHRRYGPIVRIGPSDLVIDGSIAWPEVWARKGKDEFLKPQEFFFPGDGLGSTWIPNTPLRNFGGLLTLVPHAQS